MTPRPARWPIPTLLLLMGAITAGCPSTDDGSAAVIPSPPPTQASGLENAREIRDMVLVESRQAYPVGEQSLGGDGKVVDIDAFRISRYEVTRALYLEVMGADPGASDRPGDHPVQQVTYHEAIEFCNALSERLGYEPVYGPGPEYTPDRSRDGFRLPTQAEWELACRGDTTTVFFWGSSRSTEYCVEPSGSADGRGGLAYDPSLPDEPPPFAMTAPVGSKRPNDRGLYDMAGNVQEWCDDDESIGKPWAFTRGGSWADFDWKKLESRQSVRLGKDLKLPSVGFRLVRSAR